MNTIFTVKNIKTAMFVVVMYVGLLIAYSFLVYLLILTLPFILAGISTYSYMKPCKCCGKTYHD